MALPVILKSGKNYISLVLDPDTDFNTLLTAIIKKFRQSEKFFAGKSFPIMFEGRTLSDKEKLLILDAIAQYTTVQISFLLENDRYREYAMERETYDRLHGEETEDEYGNRIKLTCDMNALTINRSVREGESIFAIGDLLIRGNVAKGAFVKAGGSIYVLGSLKGQAIAGTDEAQSDPMILAFDFYPENYRVGEILGTSRPKRKKTFSGKVRKTPRVVKVVNGSLKVEAFNV